MKCPICNGKSGTSDSRISSKGVRRTHDCQKCGHRFYTVEILMDKYDALVECGIHGKWIHKVKRYLYQPDDCEAVCSVCGMDYPLDPEYNIEWFARDNKFCSNCGSKNDEVVTE